jgi:cyclase
VHSREIADRPEGYVGPDLNPAGLILQPKELAPGVVALLANIPPKDNGGVIYGKRAALVVDAGINSEVAQQIQRLAQQIAPVPVRYLANTTYHGDHSFGNAAFPDDVIVVSSLQNRASMTDLDYEKRIRGNNLRGNDGAIAGVLHWRLPDLSFDRFLQLDLGEMIVELWCFGPGNAPGDTIVYVPSAKVAFTGNFLGHAHVAPMILEGSPGPYIRSLENMRDTIDVKTIVPGHGPPGDASEAIESMISYLRFLEQEVAAARDNGADETAAVASIDVPQTLDLPANAPGFEAIRDLNRNMHRLNVLAAYRALENAAL